MFSKKKFDPSPRGVPLEHLESCLSRTTLNTLHIRNSTDSGVTWSQDLRSFPKAKNPGLAINSAGVVGLLFQQVTGSKTQQFWETHFVKTTDNFAHMDGKKLAEASANIPIADPNFGPYLGDYDHLLAVGQDFYGIFSMSNESNFPNGVIFQRNRDSVTRHMRNLENTADVPVSIDPFFFKETGIGDGT